uniref:Interleukin 32 n=1 Tax=Bos indicus x Bos taurus TaxID=30522 RepID=A0A4W2DPY2_BOBOX
SDLAAVEGSWWWGASAGHAQRGLPGPRPARRPAVLVVPGPAARGRRKPAHRAGAAPRDGGGRRVLLAAQREDLPDPGAAVLAGSTLSALPWPALKSLGLSRQRGSAQLELWLQDLRSQRQDPEPPCASLSTSDRRGQHQFLPGQLSAGPRRARHLGTRLTRLLQGNRPPWRDPRVLASFRVLMHNLVDEFFDTMENEPEGAQMEAVLAETKEKFIKDAFKVMDNHIQENSPETLKESSPLLQEARQEVRCRIQRRSVSTSLEVQNPEESIWARALRQFLGILQSFLSGCRDALTWLWEKAAACLQAICSAVEALWEVLTDFSSFVGQLLCRSLIQV